MTQPQRIKLTDLLPDRANANAGTERGAYMVDTSIAQFGAGRSILLDKDNEVIAGNKTLQALVDAGYDEILVIETDGKQAVAVKRTDLDLDDPKSGARGLAYADNRASEVGLAWDAEQLLADVNAGIDLTTWFKPEELEKLLLNISSPEELLLGLEENSDLTKWDVPDALWATDNDWGVPLLDINLQGDAIDLPVAVWGEVSRKTQHKGTWVFYTEDNRFEALWYNPSDIINTGAPSVVEPNFSTSKDMPNAVCLWSIYRKRWLARYWQSFGKRIFVDLNVHPKAAEMNLWGVPKGWKAYATRGYSEQLNTLETEYSLACAHAGTSSILFAVYGGGYAVKDKAQELGVIWIPDTMDVVKGKFKPYGS